MTILTSINLGRLRNGEYIQMGNDTSAIIDELLAAAPEILPYAVAFNNSMAAISSVFMLDPASPLTHAIELADERRDAAVTGLTYVVQGYSYHADAAKKAAGEMLYHAITLYGSGVVSTIAKQSYAAESASITSLLGDFSDKPELAAALTSLGLSDWQAELQAANDDFKTKYQQRTDAYGDASPDTVRSLRAAADVAFKTLREKAEAYYSINNGAAPWSTLVSRLNAMVEQYKTLIASHPPGKPRKPKTA